MPIGLTGAPLQDALNKIPTATPVDLYLGTIDCTTSSKTNGTATTPFANTGDGLAGKVLVISNEGTVDVRVAGVAASADAITNTRGATFAIPIRAGSIVNYSMGTSKFLAAIATSGTANLDVWELR